MASAHETHAHWRYSCSSVVCVRVYLDWKVWWYSPWHMFGLLITISLRNQTMVLLSVKRIWEAVQRDFNNAGGWSLCRGRMQDYESSNYRIGCKWDSRRRVAEVETATRQSRGVWTLFTYYILLPHLNLTTDLAWLWSWILLDHPTLYVPSDLRKTKNGICVMRICWKAKLQLYITL